MTTSKLPELNNGILTTWLPLTTPGPSVSAACSSEIYVVPLHTTLAAFDPWYGQNINSQLSCLVAEETLWWDQSQGPSTTTFLGPFACPNGHTTVATSLFREGTTLVGCCPSGYDFQNTFYSAPTPLQCFSTLTSGQVIIAQSYGSTDFVPTTITITTTGVSVHGNQVNGYVFATESTSSSSFSISSNLSQTTLPTNTSPVSKPTVLSSGAKLSIGLGVSFGLIMGISCLVGIIWFLKRRYAMYASVNHTSTHTPPRSEDPPSEIYKSPSDYVHHTIPVELSNSPMAYEVQGANEPKRKTTTPVEIG